jgi:hypothetical protein
MSGLRMKTPSFRVETGRVSSVVEYREAAFCGLVLALFSSEKFYGIKTACVRSVHRECKTAASRPFYILDCLKVVKTVVHK